MKSGERRRSFGSSPHFDVARPSERIPIVVAEDEPVVGRAVQRDERRASGTEKTSDFDHPVALEREREMSQHRNQLNEVEAGGGKFERRGEAARLPPRDAREVLPIPADELSVHVDADEAAGRVLEVPPEEEPPGSAADIENVAGRRDAGGREQSPRRQKPRKDRVAIGVDVLTALRDRHERGRRSRSRPDPVPEAGEPRRLPRRERRIEDEGRCERAVLVARGDVEGSAAVQVEIELEAAARSAPPTEEGPELRRRPIDGGFEHGRPLPENDEPGDLGAVQREGQTSKAVQLAEPYAMVVRFVEKENRTVAQSRGL